MACCRFDGHRDRLKSGYPSFAFEVDGAEVTQGRVAPGRVIKAFDVIEHVSPGLRSRTVDLLPDPLGLER